MVLRYLTGEFELENGKLRREGTTQPRSADRLHENQTVAMVFGGGLGLAAYHAGVYQSHAERSGRLHWVAGSSAGAVTAALIAGNRSDDRVERLRSFWKFPPMENSHTSPWQHLYGWMGAIRTRLVGSSGHFHPRIPPASPLNFRSLYDLAPMQERLAALIDFGRLNSGEVRICVAATDIVTGEPVIFDSENSRIEMDHLMASCGFLPEFAPVEIDGRLLGDGGLSLNVPFDPILRSDMVGDLLLYVIDLYARDGERPNSLEAAAERKNDLLFGNQTLVRLMYCAELRKLRRKPSPDEPRDRIVMLSYRPGLEEPGPEKSFDLSTDALSRRWIAGFRDMEHSEHLVRDRELTLIRRRAPSTPAFA